MPTTGSSLTKATGQPDSHTRFGTSSDVPTVGPNVRHPPSLLLPLGPLPLASLLQLHSSRQWRLAARQGHVLAVL